MMFRLGGWTLSRAECPTDHLDHSSAKGHATATLTRNGNVKRGLLHLSSRITVQLSATLFQAKGAPTLAQRLPRSDALEQCHASDGTTMHHVDDPVPLCAKVSPSSTTLSTSSSCLSSLSVLDLGGPFDSVERGQGRPGRHGESPDCPSSVPRDAEGVAPSAALRLTPSRDGSDRAEEHAAESPSTSRSTLERGADWMHPIALDSPGARDAADEAWFFVQSAGAVDNIDRWEEAKMTVIRNENDNRVDVLRLRTAYPIQDVDWSMRRILLTWMNDVAMQLQLTESYALGVNFLDRYMSRRAHSLQRLGLSSYQCLGAACLWIAAKNSERYPPTAEDFCICGDQVFTRSDLISFEMAVLETLSWRIHHVTPILILDGLLSAKERPAQLSSAIGVRFHRWIDLAYSEAEMFIYPTSILSFSALLLSVAQPLRAETEAFIIREIKWMLARGWYADLRPLSHAAIHTMTSHQRQKMCRSAPCQQRAATCIRSTAHHMDCPYQRSETSSKRRDKRVQLLLPLTSVLQGTLEDQAVMCLAHCVTNLLLLEAHTSM